MAETLLHLRGQTGAVGVGQHLDIGLEKRAGGLDRLPFGQQFREELHHAPRAAVVSVRAQAHPARQRHLRQVVEVLHRVLEPEDAGVLVCVAEHQVPPFPAEVLALVDDHTIELPVRADRQRRRLLHQSVERLRPVKVRGDAVLAQESVAEHVQGGGHAAARRDLREVVREWAIEADIKRSTARLDRRLKLLQRELRLAGTGGAYHPQQEGLDLDLPRPVRETAGHTGHQGLGAAHQCAHVRPELDQPTQKRVDPGRLETHPAKTISLRG